MSTYTPDKWVILKINYEDKILYKVFASWYGGYANSDSWQLNSGIVSAELDEDGFYNFTGHSGSVYCCNKERYGLTNYASSVLENLLQQRPKITVLDNNVNFLDLDYNALYET